MMDIQGFFGRLLDISGYIYRTQVDIQNKDLGEFGMYIRINIGYRWGTKVDK